MLDTRDPAAPTRLSHALRGTECLSLEVTGDEAYCAAGEAGVEVIDLSSLR